MIVGNRNAGKRVAVLAIAMLIMMFVITLLVGMRKRTAPTQQPPLHPSVIVVLPESQQISHLHVRLTTEDINGSRWVLLSTAEQVPWPHPIKLVSRQLL